MQGTGGLPHARPHRSQAIKIQRPPFNDLTAHTGLRKILLSLVWLLKSSAPLSIVQICVRKPTSFSGESFRSHSSISTCCGDGRTDAPNTILLGSTRLPLKPPSGLGFQSTFSNQMFR